MRRVVVVQLLRQNVHACSRVSILLPSMPPKKNAVKETGGSWWRLPELEVLLPLVKELKPCGAYEWDKVTARYNATRPQGSAERNTESCKNKFKGLKNCSKPTGVADCPWEVREAKAIQRDIESRMAAMDSDAFGRAEGGGADEGVGGDCGEGSGGGGGDGDDEEEPGGDDDDDDYDDDDGGGGGCVSGGDHDGDDDGGGRDGGGVTAGSKRLPAASPKSSSPSARPSPTAAAVAAGLPQRLGATPAVVQTAATMKRLKLDKQLDEQQQRSAQASQERTQLIALLLQQSQQQAAQQQQMNTMMMAMMARFFPPAPPPPPAPPANE